MQICALLTRIQCKVSDTQVTVKACGPLVEKKPVKNKENINISLYSYFSRGIYDGRNMLVIID